MLKQMTIFVLALLLAATLSACTGNAQPAVGQPAPVSDGMPAVTEANAAIGETAAKTAAFTHAGVKEADASYIACRLDTEDGRKIYEIEFRTNDAEFDYDVDAFTGEVLKFDRDNAPAAPAQGDVIGETAAKTAAFTHAGVKEADASYIACKLETEDGRKVYEIEFRTNDAEFDYDVDAFTGEVLKFDRDNAPAAPAQGDVIGETAAKTAAFTHAGVKEADASRVSCRLDTEDGRKVYEIEFFAGNREYEYDIDAFTGEVLKFDRDNAPAAPAQGDVIGETAAKTAAFTHAGVKDADVSRLTCKLDIEDGRKVYEIEFFAGNREYEYDVDALTGEVLKFDRD